MKRKWVIAAVLLIVIGAFLRLWQLGVVPDGLTWDEAAIGYNGWSVWTTRRDEWLQLLPISFKSFGDFKSPLAVYLNGPFTLLFGMHPWSIRLPFALAGSALLVVWFFFLRALQHFRLLKHDVAIVFGVGVLAFSPWHLMFSRIGFESGLSLFLLVAGIFALFWYIKQKQTLWTLLLAAGLLAVSLYAYHSAKIVVPLLLLAIVLFWRRVLFKHVRHLAYGVCLGAALLAPMVYDTFAGGGGTRAAGLIPLSGEPLLAQLNLFSDSIAANTQPFFLLLGVGDELRHVSGVYGPLTISVLLLTILGVLILFRVRNVKAASDKLQFGMFAAFWIAIGFLPSFLSIEAPHANRALLALPGILLLATLAFDWVVDFVQASRGVVRLFSVGVVGVLFAAELLFTGEFLSDYFTQYSARATGSFQTGYVEAMQLAEKARSNQAPFVDVDQILFASNYGQPVIFALAKVDGEKPVSPYQYHQGYLVKYLFPDHISTADLTRKNTLLIWTINDQVDVEPTGVITDRAGQPRFYWYVTSGK